MYRKWLRLLVMAISCLACLTGFLTLVEEQPVLAAACCVTGGSGQSTCEIWPPPFNHCFVQCSTGCYACCNATAATCVCYANGTGPEFEPDGCEEN